MGKMLLKLYLLTIFAAVGTLAYTPLEPITTEPLNIPGQGRIFKPTNQLRSSYLQSSSVENSHQRADLVFDTTIPSLNPDETGAIKTIECAQDGGITLTLKDDDYLQMVNSWPKEDLMLLISHRWECFGKKTTQFFLAGNKTIDANNIQVHFTTKPCDVLKWSSSFALDVTWEKTPKKQLKLNSRRNRHQRRGKLLNRLKKQLAEATDINVDKENKIDLNMLFDEKTGKSSKPNFPLINLSQSAPGNVTSIGESVLCGDCFTEGEATITLHVEGQALPNPVITNATLAVEGHLNVNVDIKINNRAGLALNTPDFQLIEIPLTPLGVPNVFNIGPSLILATSARVSTDVTGTVYTGGKISYPNFRMSASLLDNNNPDFTQSGFEPQTTPKEPSTGLTESAGVSGSLKTQLALSVNVLNGLLQAKTGFQLVTTLGADISVGSESGCSNPKQPHIETSLTGGLGFFVQSVHIPTVTFAKKVLGEKCV